MDKIVPKRKKIYLVCAVGEYRYVWQHLHEIIDVKREELIIPYAFMEPEKINEELKAMANEVVLDTNISNDKIAKAVYKLFLRRKNDYFKKYVQDAEEIILLNSSCICDDDDITEKNQEIAACKEFNKPTRITNLEKAQEKTI